MSESTYFEMTTKTQFNVPIVELEYLLFGEWDSWKVEPISSKEFFPDETIEDNDEEYYSTNVFKVIIFELSEAESQSIILSVLKKAEEMNVSLTINTINPY